MKVEKFMCEVAKALIRDKRVIFLEYCDWILISYNAFFAMIIPKQRNIFNRESSKNDHILRDWNSHKLADTSLSTMIDKTPVRIFETEKGEKVHINEKYLNYFDRCAEFYGECKNPVFVSEDGGKTPCGLIMPINVK